MFANDRERKEKDRHCENALREKSLLHIKSSTNLIMKLDEEPIESITN